MIAPEPAKGINPQTSLRVLLLRTLALSALIFALLEIWRPYYFLTDDNLDGGLPFFTGVGRNLLAGHSPFISHNLFGGHYNFLRDPSYFVWHPVYLLFSLLAGTPFHLAIIDADAGFMLLLATAGFVVLAHYLRRELKLAITDRWITFYALSYTYTMIALTTGASWHTFLGNIASLPWLVLGILQGNWRRGVPLVMLFVLNETLGGHLEPTVSNSLFLSLFALGMCLARRSAVPMVNWLAGYVVAIIIILPLLLPMLDGFAHSARAGGTGLDDMQNNNIPAPLFVPSIFLGMSLWIINPHGHPYVTYTLALGSSAAVWCLLPAVIPPFSFRARHLRAFLRHWLFSGAPLSTFQFPKRPHELRWRAMELVAASMVVFGMIMIVRPFFITQIMAHLPLLKAMRWPFREFVQFQFFLHLFLLIRPPGLNAPARNVSAVFGTFVFVVPLVLYPFPPTFNSMNWDRELVISGGYEKFWSQVRPLLKPDDRVAVLIPFGLYTNDRFEEPYSLLGTYNYATLEGFVNTWGYSPTAPRDQLYTKTYAVYPFGAYCPDFRGIDQEAQLLAEKPGLKFITLESLQPLHITLSSRDGPTIDLTPFVPKRKSKVPVHEAGLP